MIGQVLGHCRVVAKIGEGGMGVVYKAQDTKLDRPVAIKFLPRHLSASEENKARFMQEARAQILRLGIVASGGNQAHLVVEKPLP